MRRPAPRLIGFRPLPVFTMELFTKLFGDLLVFLYHCFDRIVIHGYLSALSRPEQVVYFGPVGPTTCQTIDAPHH
jgi:hypothetical protein